MPWEPYFSTVMQIERQLQKIDDHRFVDLAYQMIKRIQAILTSGKIPFARAEIETSKDWKVLCGMASNDLCCEALLWLEELLAKL